MKMVLLINQYLPRCHPQEFNKIEVNHYKTITNQKKFEEVGEEVLLPGGNKRKKIHDEEVS